MGEDNYNRLKKLQKQGEYITLSELISVILHEAIPQVKFKPRGKPLKKR
jgi:hypothetical protein